MTHLVGIVGALEFFVGCSAVVRLLAATVGHVKGYPAQQGLKTPPDAAPRAYSQAGWTKRRIKTRRAAPGRLNHNDDYTVSSSQ